MRRAGVVFAAVAVVAAAGALIGLSSAGAKTEKATAVNEEIVIGGVTVYRTERDAGPAVYTLDPLSDGDVADLADAPPPTRTAT